MLSILENIERIAKCKEWKSQESHYSILIIIFCLFVLVPVFGHMHMLLCVMFTVSFFKKTRSHLKII